MRSEALCARFAEDGRRQPLRDHCHSVAKIARASCDFAGLGSLGAFIGVVHDCHKADPAWQAYLFAQMRGEMEDRVNHAPQAARWIWRRYGEGEKDAGKKLTAQIAAMAVYAHHGTLFDVLAPDGKAVFFERMAEEGQDGPNAAFFEQVAGIDELDGLFSAAAMEVKAAMRKLEQSAPKSAKQGAQAGEVRECRDFFAGLLARFAYSSLIDADRYDAACFEAGEVPACESTADWEALVFAFEENLGKKVEKTVQMADARITAARRRIADACRDFARNGAGVYRLYAPTGAGKSFATLRFALHHAALHHKSRIVVVEPYLTIIDQIAREYRDVLGENAVLEYHSNVAPQEEEARVGRILAERFESPVVVTTLVQFLDALYAAKGSAARRMRAFANAVIVLDEVQAVPVQCVDLFNLAVRFLADACGATVVLCTATQPKLSCADHPLALDAPCDLLPDFSAWFPAFSRVEIRWEKGARTAAELAAFLRSVGEVERSVLAVVNTKAAARALFTRLAEESGPFCSVFFLSTHMCPAHRLDVIESIQRALAQGMNIAVVSTSLIEFGVDLSFDCVVRSLAGVPSIAQAAGRCNRHGAHGKKRVFVVQFQEERLQGLREIETGQTVTRFLLRTLEHNKRPATDLLAPDVIDRFYEDFFDKCRPFLGYKAETGVSSYTTLVNLLGSNRTARNYAKRRPDESLLAQSFETANRQFRVIEDHTAGILVPYREGKRIIEELGAQSLDVLRAKCLLRKAQRYTVNVFEGKLKELFRAGCLHSLSRVGAVALREGFYDETTGIAGDAAWNPDDCIV